MAHYYEFAVRGQASAVTRQRYPQGTSEAITLAIHYPGLMCFWSGDGALLRLRTGRRLSRLMAPCSTESCSGNASQDKQAMEAVSANRQRRNLLRFIQRSAVGSGRQRGSCVFLAGRRGAPVAMLTIVLNATSIQLIHSTVAAVRAARALRTIDICCRCGSFLRLPVRRCCSAMASASIFGWGISGTGSARTHK